MKNQEKTALGGKQKYGWYFSPKMKGVAICEKKDLDNLFYVWREVGGFKGAIPAYHTQYGHTSALRCVHKDEIIAERLKLCGF
ncbi:MAG: hypothetical protein K6F57_00940 [Candidatus Saccharibacteria bacterium]|nr:hypothetical protein [Candidatus Saccharibacteria bacterium]